MNRITEKRHPICGTQKHRPGLGPRIPALVLVIALLAMPTLLAAQQPPRDWAAFAQAIDVSAWQGRPFKVTAAIRSQCMDPGAGAELWVRIDKADNKMGFFYNMMDKPIRDSQWKIYTVQGKVDRNAKWLNFGGLYQHKGNFFFDDFHLYIETAAGHWEDIPVKNAGFEGDSATFKKGWGFFGPQRSFITRASRDSAYEGHSSIWIDGAQFKDVATYGHNDSAGRFVSANGISLYVETYGQGQPLLLLHGNSSSIGSFEKQIPELSKHYQVIAVDTRGQGRSGEDGRTYTYDLFAGDMKALLDTLRLDSVDILGWSDGGNTGLIMAMKYPRKVRKLAAMGANIFIDGTVVAPWVFDTLRNQQREWRDDTTRAGLNRNRLITLLLTEPRHSFAELGAIQCPVLVMAGQHDVIRESHTRQIAKHIPRGKLLLFRNGTHSEPEENPARFNKAVLDFFAGP